MKILETDKKDADVLKELWIKSLKNEKRLNNNIDLKSEIKDFNRGFPKLFKKNKYFLAEEDERILGFIGGEIKIGSGFFNNKKIGTIHALFVVEEYRNRGIGAELIKTFVLWLKTKKAEIAELAVSSRNTNALKLYENLGFNDFIIIKRKKI